jgi:hypothetical protein
MADKIGGSSPHQSEERLQAKCFQWFWNSYPLFRRTMFAVPNGGARNLMEASRMKATGTVAGVSDLVWVHKGVVYFIEMKTKTGTQSSVQMQFEKAVTEAGAEYVVIRSFEEFQRYVIWKIKTST